MGRESRSAQAPIQFRFNDRKAAQAAAYLLKLNGGSMKYLPLIKLLYFADRKMLLRHGQTITGDTMVSMQHGPVLSGVYDRIKRNPLTRITPDWSEHITDPDDYKVALKAEAPTDELSQFEIELLDSTYKELGSMNPWAIRDKSHALPEWKDPKGSCCLIKPEDILRHEDVPEKDIERIRADAAELLFFSSAVR